jgi:hypothetical protein
MVYGEWPRQLDHINNDRADNRIANLRLATNAQNGANRGPPRTNTSGVKGIYWFKPKQRWSAEIIVDGRRIMLGYYKEKEDAIMARMEAEAKYQGEYAWDPLRDLEL